MLFVTEEITKVFFPIRMLVYIYYYQVLYVKLFYNQAFPVPISDSK